MNHCCSRFACAIPLVATISIAASPVARAHHGVAGIGAAGIRGPGAPIEARDLYSYEAVPAWDLASTVIVDCSAGRNSMAPIRNLLFAPWNAVVAVMLRPARPPGLYVCMLCGLRPLAHWPFEFAV